MSSIFKMEINRTVTNISELKTLQFLCNINNLLATFKSLYKYDYSWCHIHSEHLIFNECVV